MVGYREAVTNSKIKKIETGIGAITIKVAPIPSTVFLKLVACFERVESNDFNHANKHLNDILKCMKQYESESDRRFNYIEEVNWAEDQFECAGAFLLGMDLKRNSSHEVHESFDKFLSKCRSYELSDSGKMMLDCFKQGFTHENYR